MAERHQSTKTEAQAAPVAFHVLGKDQLFESQDREARMKLHEEKSKKQVKDTSGRMLTKSSELIPTPVTKFSKHRSLST